MRRSITNKRLPLAGLRASIKSRAAQQKSQQSKLLLLAHLREHFAASNTPIDIVTELRFHPERAWRFDVAIPSRRLAIEIEGGVHSGGRHTRGLGFIDDCDKYAAALLLGWRVLRVPTQWVATGRAARLAAAACLPGFPPPPPLPIRPTKRQKRARIAALPALKRRAAAPATLPLLV